MTTAARPTSEQSCHWYFHDGRACYEVPRAKGDGMRPTTLADARKLNLLPSVTTILGVLHKEALVQWRVEQAVLACLTAPKRNDEPLDDFVTRILHTERHQDQEGDEAKARGTEIHDALEAYFTHGEPSLEVVPWIDPVIKYLARFGTVIHSEHILVGNGYAGKCDLIFEDSMGVEWVIDFKSTKAAKLPTKSYWEHKMQTAAYAQCRQIRHHANIYISTVECGAFSFCDNESPSDPWRAFASLLEYWRVTNNFYP